MSEKAAETHAPAIDPLVARNIRRILLKWGKKNYQNFPWRNTNQPWQALIAEVLLQRTRAKNAVPVYLELVQQFKHPNDLAEASLSQIEKLIYPLGLRWRAPLIKKLGMELAHRNGIVPDNLDKLLLLPGVGPYAASAWLSFHGNKRAVIVDTNVVRLICRLVDVPMHGETRRKKWLIQTANLLTPRRAWKDYNYAVLDFTMQVCTKIPKCPICPLLKYCSFGRKAVSA